MITVRCARGQVVMVTVHLFVIIVSCIVENDYLYHMTLYIFL